jgi:phosphonate transport system substrate-binding protein
MFSPLADILSKRLEREVRLDIRKDFPDFWRGVVEKEYDIVHYNQYQYVKSHKLYNYDAILMNEEQGEKTLTPALWVRNDSEINSIEDLRDQTIMFGGGKEAMMAYIAPKYLLKQAGLEQADYVQKVAINPLAGCRAMYLGQIDACGAGTIMFRLPRMRKETDPSQVRVLAQGEPLAHLTWAVHPNMDKNLHDLLQTEMKNLDESEEGQSVLKSMQLTDLAVAIDSDYDPHRKIIEYVFDEKY